MSGYLWRKPEAESPVMSEAGEIVRGCAYAQETNILFCKTFKVSVSFQEAARQLSSPFSPARTLSYHCRL
jgi:hypothetical protein